MYGITRKMCDSITEVVAMISKDELENGCIQHCAPPLITSASVDEITQEEYEDKLNKPDPIQLKIKIDLDRKAEILLQQIKAKELTKLQ